MKKNIKKYSLIFAFLSLNCNLSLSADNELIIFIHGTIVPLTSIPTSSKEFKQLFGIINNSKNTQFTQNFLSRFYQRHLNQARMDGIHKYQPISSLGLKKFGNIENKKQLQKFKEIFIKRFNDIQPKNTYKLYTFGWDGRIDAEKRKNWAKVLYKQLLKKINKLKDKTKEKINIQIYAHSHGGNVALNLASIKQDPKINIKNLVLFGTPIQKNTSQYANSDIFENIYNFYSEMDSIQILGNKLPMNLNSRRKFNINSNKIKEIEVTSGNKKPTHWELWFFGAANSNFFQNFFYKTFLYRTNFPLHPYPISIFAPQIINQIKNNESLDKKQDFYANIKKQNNTQFEIYLEPKNEILIQSEFKP